MTGSAGQGGRFLWRLRPENLEGARGLEEKLDLPGLTARILANRGHLPSAEALQFLDAPLRDLPSPLPMADMDKAVRRLRTALDTKEQVLVYGDYDVDGITSTALLLLFLDEMGLKARFRLPHRLKEGYGLNGTAVEEASREGVSLLITVDCGIGNAQEIEQANAAGMDVIVLDHHHLPPQLPPALAVINPERPDCLKVFEDMAGVGLAFSFCASIRASLREEGFFSPSRPEPDLRLYLDLVALGTVGDVVPLRGPNRILVRHGLRILEQTTRPGLRALAEVAGLHGDKPLTSWDVAFRLAPRINAAGRMGDPSRGVRLLITSSQREASTLAAELDQANQQRRQVEDHILAEAKEAVEAGDPGVRDHALVLANADWHPGVIGIVASRLAEKYRKPAVVIALEGERGVGSCRGIAGLHLFQALEACQDHLLTFGGHEMAAGLRIRQDKIIPFASSLDQFVASHLGQVLPQPPLDIDTRATLGEITTQAVSSLDRLGPFGSANPAPLLLFSGVETKFVRRAADRLHFTAVDGSAKRDAIQFRTSLEPADIPPRIDLVARPHLDHYQGRLQLTLYVEDLRPSSSGERG